MNWFLNLKDDLSDQIVSSAHLHLGEYDWDTETLWRGQWKTYPSLFNQYKKINVFVSDLWYTTCEQINTFSGPQCSHRFILQFRFGVTYICLKFCSLDKLCILVFFNLTKSFLKPFNHLTNQTVFSTGFDLSFWNPVLKSLATLNILSQPYFWWTKMNTSTPTDLPCP